MNYKQNLDRLEQPCESHKMAAANPGASVDLRSLCNPVILRTWVLVCVLVAVVMGATCVQTIRAQTPSATGNGSSNAADARLNTLPPALRERGATLLNEANEKERARLATELMRTDAEPATDFLLALLNTEASALVRRSIIDRLGKRSAASIREALERHAATDKDAGVALLALERLRELQAEEMRRLLAKRMEMARASRDRAELRRLAEEQERWISLARGTMLPGFMRRVPPLFSLKKEAETVRVLAFGDFGTGSEGQRQTAAAMLNFHRKMPFDFGITLGDNFYSEGMTSPADPRWQTQWEALYAPLGIRFYATLGNHDWQLADSPAAEILYSQRSESWRMPAPYYTFTAGPVQFFALDTNEVSEQQLMWLEDELGKSRAMWKVVYGHHPIYSAGQHGDNGRLIRQLLPVLRGKADVYLTGHDHDMQHLKPEDGVHFFIAGGGGAKPRPLRQSHPRALFGRDALGFAVFEADAKELKVQFIAADGSQLYQYALRRQ